MSNCFHQLKKMSEKPHKANSTKFFEIAKYAAKRENLRALSAFQIKKSENLIITPSHFMLSNFSNKSKTPTVIPWSELRNIKFSDTTIKFVFHNNEEYNVKLSGSDFEKAKYDILDTLQRVLYKDELMKLNFQQFKIPPVYYNTNSALARFRMSLYRNKTYTFTPTDKKIQEAIYFGSRTVDIREAPDAAHYFTLLCNILPFMTSTRIFKIPIIHNVEAYKDTSKLTSRGSALRCIEIKGKCPQLISNLITAIRSSNKSNINSLALTVSKLGMPELQYITDSVASGQIKSLALHSAIKDEAYPAFYATFLTSQLIDNLYILNLDRSPHIDINLLFPKIRNIRMLSLESCELDLGMVFNAMSLHSFLRLKALNLSGNEVKTKPLEGCYLCPTLEYLYLDDIGWPEGITITDFIKYLFAQVEETEHRKLALSLNHALAQKNDWLTLFQYLEDASFTNLSALYWDHNPVHPNLFKYLLRCPHLSTLHMSGCFREGDVDSITDLINFLAQPQSIHTLVLRGNNHRFFGPDATKSIIGALVYGKQELDILDIGNSRGGPEVLNLLLNLQQQIPNLKKVNFDGLFTNEKRDYHEELFSALIQMSPQKGNNLLVSYPLDDIQFLLDEHLVTEKQVRSLQKKLFYEPKVSSSSQLSPLSTPVNSPKSKKAQKPYLSNPSRIFKLSYDDEDAGFPSYLSKLWRKRFSKESTFMEGGPSSNPLLYQTAPIGELTKLFSTNDLDKRKESPLSSPRYFTMSILNSSLKTQPQITERNIDINVENEENSSPHKNMRRVKKYKRIRKVPDYTIPPTQGDYDEDWDAINNQFDIVDLFDTLVDHKDKFGLDSSHD